MVLLFLGHCFRFCASDLRVVYAIIHCASPKEKRSGCGYKLDPISLCAFRLPAQHFIVDLFNTIRTINRTELVVKGWFNTATFQDLYFPRRANQYFVFSWEIKNQMFILKKFEQLNLIYSFRTAKIVYNLWNICAVYK